MKTKTFSQLKKNDYVAFASKVDSQKIMYKVSSKVNKYGNLKLTRLGKVSLTYITEADYSVEAKPYHYTFAEAIYNPLNHI